MFSSSQRYALDAERWTVEQLQARGYDAQLLPIWISPFDILINAILPCEVKIAKPKRQRAGRNGNVWRYRYQFKLSGNHIDTDYVLIAICDTPDGWQPFIIPSWWIVGRQTLQITQLNPELYSGYVANAFNNWELIEIVLQKSLKYLQLTLPFRSLVNAN
jgi:hypothetical protein